MKGAEKQSIGLGQVFLFSLGAGEIPLHVLRENRPGSVSLHTLGHVGEKTTLGYG